MTPPSNPRLDRIEALATVVDGLQIPGESIRYGQGVNGRPEPTNLADVIREGFRKRTEGRYIGLRFEAFDAIIQTIGTLRTLVEQQGTAVQAPWTLITSTNGTGALYDSDGSLVESGHNYVIQARALTAASHHLIRSRTTSQSVDDWPTALTEVI